MRGPARESPCTTIRGPEKCLLWVLPLPVFMDSASSTGSPRTTMRGPARSRKGQVPLPVFLDTASSTGSPRTAMRGPLSGIPGYRVEHRVTPHYDAGSREGRRGIYLPVFLDTASRRGMTSGSPRTTMRGPARECEMTGRRGPGKELDNNGDTSDFVPLDDKKNGHTPSKKEQKTGARNKKIAMFNISNVKNQGRKICSINNFFALSTILVKF